MVNDIAAIRWAEVDDACAIAEVHVASWQAAYRGIVPSDVLEQLSVEQRAIRQREQILKHPRSAAVVMSDQRIVGFCAFGDCRDDDKPGGVTGEIIAIYLEPSHWRRGFGSRLLRWAEDQLRLRKKTEAILWVLEDNNQSRHFYEAMGYQPDGARKMDTIGIALPHVRYARVLSRLEELHAVPRRVAEYWAGVFGIAPAEFTASGTRVIPNAGKVAGREASWIFRHGQTCIVAAPPRLVPDLERRVGQMNAERMQSIEGGRHLFGDLVQKTVGPAYQGHIAPEEFRRCLSPCVRKLVAEDKAALAAVTALPDWEDCGLAANDPNLYGSFASGKLACVAGLIHWDASVVNVGVITAPPCRRQGHARATVSAAVREGLERGYLILYQTLLANTAAVRLAESLGCRQYTQHLYISLSEATEDCDSERDT